MLKLLAKYSDVISSYKISRFEHFGQIFRFRAELILTDNTILYVRETVLSMSIRKYSYHWQDRRGKLIMRWDNAPDWDVKTFPHHVHVGKEDAVEPSFDRTLDKVLSIVRRQLLKINDLPPAKR
ncbi:MAG: hypothetical protein CO012_00065 [Syntrophobacterales bacterium CG_4_8_14_3_um_filter_49_14]|nr:MAG: hypothetical protein COX52_05855 [Syntrophobacterales bacterium CG23_combo_of_CG06-09_8_20_14_all_48_27]PJA50204.1 MAG: hypothetical protein CO171_03020 [Syntrophobacterales bacterium CG_4_9_14_3_um_filter_49_8]PJC77135.1 MAG: hypothetical protein CO012_00065 [Syntrophobacterales bacterium CG_4_8_14_3_um_filter_49_14]